MTSSLWRAAAFLAFGAGALVATGPLVGTLAATIGIRSFPVWLYAGCFSAILLGGTFVALRLDGRRMEDAGLAPTGERLFQFVWGFGLSAALFVLVALTRGASVNASWTFAGVNAVPAALAGAVVALLLLLPEELMFRGYAFQQLVKSWGAPIAIGVSALLFGAYHLFGSGMWGMGAFVQFMMPALGGVVFGIAAVRGRGLALPVGLHLGGNWVQSSVLAFRPSSGGASALWTMSLDETSLRALASPDLMPHLPFIAAMLVAGAFVVIVTTAKPTLGDTTPNA